MPTDRRADILSQLRRREVAFILRVIRHRRGDRDALRYYTMQAQECRCRIEYIEKELK